MFDAIGQIATRETQGNEASYSSQAVAAKSMEAASPVKSATVLSYAEQVAQAQNKVTETKQPAQSADKQVTEKMLQELEQDIEAIHSVGLKFTKFDALNRTYVKVIDRTTDEVIREIPSEEVLKLAAKMEEMIGILFDKKV